MHMEERRFQFDIISRGTISSFAGNSDSVRRKLKTDGKREMIIHDMAPYTIKLISNVGSEKFTEMCINFSASR